MSRTCVTVVESVTVSSFSRFFFFFLNFNFFFFLTPRTVESSFAIVSPVHVNCGLCAFGMVLAY